jgi:hypothetical protein
MTCRRRACRTGTWLALASLGWTVGIGIFWLVAPTSTSVSVAVSDSGDVARSTSQETLLQAEGASVLVPLAIPLALALVGTVPWARRARQVRLATGTALAIFSIIAGFSIGLFYAPAALLLLASGRRRYADKPQRA